MDVLAIVHGPNVGAGVFADAVRRRGDRLLEWVPSSSADPQRPDAVLVFGGAMHVDQEAEHPWLRVEVDVLRRLLDAGTPVLGVCLGAQLLAQAAGAQVGPAPEPEIGWLPVELTADAREDPVFGSVPERFDAFQWHHYAFDVPAGATELARSTVCSQAFRLDGNAWGVQFHPEVTLEQVESWLDEKDDVDIDWDALAAETERRIDQWNEFGRDLCTTFLEAIVPRARVRPEIDRPAMP
jgi:GMP synthase (glutamine-hydrolysing)